MAEGRTLGEKHAAIARADRLKPLLDDVAVWDALEERFSREWRHSSGPESVQGQAAWYKIQAIEALQNELRRIIGEGEHAREVLRQTK